MMMMMMIMIRNGGCWTSDHLQYRGPSEIRQETLLVEPAAAALETEFYYRFLGRQERKKKLARRFILFIRGSPTWSSKPNSRPRHQGGLKQATDATEWAACNELI